METVEHYRADMDKTALFCLYGALAFVYLNKEYCRLPYPEIPAAYDGNRWRYIGHTESADNNTNRIGRQTNSNCQSRGHYAVEQFNLAGYAWKPLLYDFEINVCEDILIANSTEDKWNLASCIEKGWIESRQDGLKVKLAAMNIGEYKKFVMFVERDFAEILPEWDAAAERLAKGYAGLFPKHLAGDGARLSRYLWFSSVGELFKLWQDDGRLLCANPGESLAVMLENEKSR